MSSGFPAEIIAEAESEERFQRTVAFLNLPERISGLWVMPMTLRHVVVLESIGSPFVCGGTPTANDVVNFLWILNPKFERSKTAKQWFYLWHCRKLNAVDTVKGIISFLNEAFSDSIGGGGSNSRQFICNTTAVVGLIASEFGWSEDAILDLSVRKSLGYCRFIIKRRNPGAFIPSRAVGVVADWIRERDKACDN